VDVAHEANARSFDPRTRAILAELRDLRREMRAERQERRRADEERQQRSDERFDRLMREHHADTERVAREFREDSVRRDAVTQKAFAGMQHAFKDVHAVGLSIVKTLNRHGRYLEHHGRFLERIDRKLGVRGNGRSGPENGRPK
jgi:hypothetical protein